MDVPCEKHRPVPGAAGAQGHGIPGAGPNPSRRTAWDLIAADKGGKLINMDAQAPNRVFAEWAQERWADVRPEVRYGRSRLDFCLDGHHLVEVKGVTLEQDGRCRFPDAPTGGGTRHLHELIRAVEEGVPGHGVFIIKSAGPRGLLPTVGNGPGHLWLAWLCARPGRGGDARWCCRVTPGFIALNRPVPVRLADYKKSLLAGQKILTINHLRVAGRANGRSPAASGPKSGPRLPREPPAAVTTDRTASTRTPGQIARQGDPASAGTPERSPKGALERWGRLRRE